MSETKKIDANSLYALLLREVENDSVQELDPKLYTNIAEFLGNLKSQDYDGVESKIKDSLVNMITDMTSLLLRIRIEKAIALDDLDYSNLLDEERFILDSEDELRQRRETILSATLNGRLKLLETVARNHRSRTIVVRFLRPIDQIVGTDLQNYGPFEAEDVATLPFENARALITKKVAAKISWED
ncbi:MAG: DNA replication complex GINS family protein [Thaumarchaeota archaeon]|nr:DNA replication complex GINS family protein [Nitrososphaerota archaeon]